MSITLIEGNNEIEIPITPIAPVDKAHLEIIAYRQGQPTYDTVANARVEVTLPDGSVSVGYTNVDGRFRQVYGDQGTISIDITKSGYYGWSGTAELILGQTTLLTVGI